MSADQAEFPAVGADKDDEVIVRVCECGRIGNDGYTGVRCGDNAVTNMSASCPTVRMRVVAWEEVTEPTRASS